MKPKEAVIIMRKHDVAEDAWTPLIEGGKLCKFDGKDAAIKAAKDRSAGKFLIVRVVDIIETREVVTRKMTTASLALGALGPDLPY